jgi:hypothetical protein
MPMAARTNPLRRSGTVLTQVVELASRDLLARIEPHEIPLPAAAR